MTGHDRVELFWWLLAAVTLLVAVCPLLYQSIVKIWG